MDISPISEMPSLMKRLGKSGVDRIKASTIDTSAYRDSRHTLTNTIQKEMQRCYVNQYGKVSEIISNVAQNTDGDKPLNISRIYVLFQCLGKIDTRRVARICDLSDTQAREYVRACRIALPYLEKYFNKEPDYDREDFDEGGYLTR